MDPELEGLLETFITESEENLRALDEGFVILESKPDDAETLASIFRMAHTLKGNAASLGFEGLAELAHAVESILDRFREHTLAVTPSVVNVLLESVDALRELVTDAAAGTDRMRASHRAILARLANETLGEGVLAPPAVAPSGDTPHAANEGGSRKRSLRVDVERLNRLLNLTGEIAIERQRVRELIEKLAGKEGEKLLERHTEADALHTELHELVMKLRMVPIGPTFRQYMRTVRDVSASVGKMARLVLKGEDVEMDTALVEHIHDPLTHMIRNAIDHGIEPPEARRARGKDPCGVITLRARHDAGGVVIQVADDGAGLRKEAIIARAIEMGLPGVSEMKPRELYGLVFRAGFSTAKEVTDLSGRGVGMEVVDRNVRAMRGSISIDSHEGEGTTFSIRLPLTVAIIDGFAVTAGQETYIVPLELVTECLVLPSDAGRTRQGVVQVRGQAVPFVRLRDLFRMRGSNDARATSGESLVVVKHQDEQVGLAVDQLLGVSQVVIKSPGKLLEKQPGLAGSTILGTGRVAFILDVPELLRMASRAPSGMSERSRATWPA